MISNIYPCLTLSFISSLKYHSSHSPTGNIVLIELILGGLYLKGNAGHFKSKGAYNLTLYKTKSIFSFSNNDISPEK